MQTYCLRDDEFRNRHPYRDISKVAFRRGKTSCIAMVHRTRSGSGSHLINDNVCVITSVEDPRLRQYITVRRRQVKTEKGNQWNVGIGVRCEDRNNTDIAARAFRSIFSTTRKRFYLDY